MATLIDALIFVFVIALFMFLPYLGNYGVLVFICLFGLTYVCRPRTS